ncbi:glycosyltransferase [Candidatus Sulfidibacterium hydrothermale]|uniref:glycosyltransferase n=1 Tax=Candidatus Sulfidibacterium hydrothermale TaxID=2875962 RepID=UPI001F0AB84C|nr:glycosyltransferase [Candidatus Sulfidibacterium hydrothermale]UBM63107.1 glycosyltransferase [Candidatus Sulfidibacterium hydrothermale]
MSNKKSRLHILHLARWYPNRTDPMPGLFIQKHAESTALYADAALVYAHGLPAKTSVPLYDVQYEEKNGVRTARVYYRLPRIRLSFVSSAIGLWRFYRALFKGIKKVKPAGENFDVLHVHVLTRLGMVALFYKWRHNTPYIITEHWTRYLPVRNEFNGWWRKKLTRQVIKKASVVTTVSKDLTRAMKQSGLPHPDYRVVYNVVDPVFFTTEPDKQKDKNKAIKELVHVSCFTDVQKNISGLLRVIQKLAQERSDFHFTLVGEGADLEQMKQEALMLNIPDKALTFTGLLEGKALAETMAQADALVLFSHYENMPVVINESFVLGVPVFSTRVGGIDEMINENNGRLVPRGDEEALKKVLADFLDGKFTFDKKKIKQFARQHFSPEATGQMLVKIYQDILKKRK